MPVRSGLPSGVLGAGAARFGLPSGVRGVFGSGTFTHWLKRITAAAAVRFIKEEVRPPLKTERCRAIAGGRQSANAMARSLNKMERSAIAQPQESPPRQSKTN